MERDLTRIGERARKNPKEPFNSIYHYMYDVGHLYHSFMQLEERTAPGVDGETVEEYGADPKKLLEKLKELAERLARMGYRPQAVKRSYIPKPGSAKKRPLGIPTVEDRVVQMALKLVMEQVYEAEFLDCSYGYRPNRSQHEALGGLGRTIQQKRVSYVVEVDIKGFFDHVNHEWLNRMLEQRIQDQRVLRLVVRMLKAGVMEDGQKKASEEGTPQGGVISPLLSNVYLHYALDLWFEKRFRKSCRGEVYFFRYADDFLACFQYKEEAERFLRELKARLEKFHLEIEPTKTKLIEFGRFAEKNAGERGKEPETFDFLGFTHYCGKTRKGVFKVKRRTSKKKFRAKLKEYKAWMMKERHSMKAGELLKKAKRKLEGHLQYYAITDNLLMCQSFRYQVERMLFKWLNRRSQKKSYNWARFRDALTWVGWPSVYIRRKMCPFQAQSG